MSTKRIKARKRWRRHSLRMAGAREPNGRLSRRAEHAKTRETETEKSAMATAVEARIRVFGMTEADARRQEAGTVIGRMYQRKDLSLDQFSAGMSYLEARNAYHTALDAKSDTGRRPAEGRPPQGSYDDFCAMAIERWDAVARVLKAVRDESRSMAPEAALDAFVVQDVFNARLVGDLLIVLNALHRHFSGERRRKAA